MRPQLYIMMCVFCIASGLFGVLDGATGWKEEVGGGREGMEDRKRENMSIMHLVSLSNAIFYRYYL